MKPIVSVIIPVYNAEQYLRECLDSVVNQTLRDIEIICVDDGSTDDSLAILREYEAHDSRFIVLTQQNMYAGVARNHGMAKAKGEYLLFLDADDYYSPELIEKTVARADETNADICVFKAERYDEVTKKTSPITWSCDIRLCPQEPAFSRLTNRKNIFYFTTPAPWTKLFRRSFIMNNDLTFQNTRSANDAAFVMSALAIANRITVLDDVLVTYRVNNAASLQGSQDKQPDAFYKALLELKNRLVSRGVYDEIQPAFINFALSFCFYNLRTMKTPRGFEETFFLLKNTAFSELDLLRWPEEYFYVSPNQRLYEHRRDVMNLSIIEYVQKYNLFGFETMRLDRLEAELIRASASYKIGRFITWLPRRIREFCHSF